MVGVGKGGRQVSRDFGHIRPSLCDRDPRLEPSDSVDPQTCAALHQQGVRPLADRSINILLMETWRKQAKPRRNYADDGEILSVEGDALAQYVRRGTELSPPQALADQRHRAGARLFF
jgi:hypothetical protein